MGEDSTAQEGPKLLLDEVRSRVLSGACEEGLELLANDAMQERMLRRARCVAFLGFNAIRVHRTAAMRRACRSLARRRSSADLAGGRFATLAVMPVIATFWTSGDTFISLWMGADFAASAGRVLLILSFGSWASASFQVLASTMMGIERHRGMVPAYIAEGLANLLLCVILVQEVGLPGIALGILLPRLAISLGFGPAYARLVLGTRISAYWWQTLLRPVLAVLPFAAASWAVDIWWRPASLWLYFAQIGAILPLAALGTWGAGLSREERRAILSRVALRWRRLRYGALGERAGSGV